MAKWLHTDVLDLGLQRILDQVTANDVDLVLLSAYSAGDNFATVDGNVICNVETVIGNYTLGNQGTNGRRVAVAALSGTASGNSGATPDLHIGLLDRTDSKVLAVTDETTDQVVTSGNPVDFPAWNIDMNQPV